MDESKAEEKRSSRDHPLFDQFRRGEMIHSQAKRVILNVFAHLSTVSPDKSWNKIADETAALVGTSAKTVLLLKNEKLKSIDGGHRRPVAKTKAAGENHLENNGSRDSVGDRSSTANLSGGAKRKRKAKRAESPRSRKRKYTQVQKKRIDRYDESVLNAIRRKMLAYAEKGIKPSFSDVLDEINVDSTLPVFSKFTFRCLLRDMGLKGCCRGRWPDKDATAETRTPPSSRGRRPQRHPDNDDQSKTDSVSTRDPQTGTRSVNENFLLSPSLIYVNDNYSRAYHQHPPHLTYNDSLLS